MKNKAMRVLTVLVLLLAMVTTIVGCGGGGKDNNPPAGTDGTKAAESTTASEPTTQEEKVTLTMFMCNSGLTIPDKVDPSDNKFINIVKKYANVDLKVEVPQWQDYTNRLNIVLASNELPDILHTNNVVPVNAAAEKGAFIDVKSLYDKSPEIQKWITPEMMEMAMYKGHYYRVPMASGKDAPQGGGAYARRDFIDKYCGGVFPDTIEGWIEAMKKVKKDYPNSAPLTAWQNAGYMFLGGSAFFQWYGAKPNSFRVQEGKIISTFVLPEYREAIELHRSLYKEGLLDKKFATNDWTGWYEALDNKALLASDGADQMLPLVNLHTTSKGTDADRSDRASIAFAPPLKTYPSVLKDVKYTYEKMQSPIIFHGVYISTPCKYPERAWRVLEGLASDELNEMIYWGQEGAGYSMKDGKKVPDAKFLGDTQEHYYGLQLSIIRGFAAGQEAKKVQFLQNIGEESYNYSKKSIDMVAGLAEQVGYDVMTLIPTIDEIAIKLPESNLFIGSATADAIAGNITMEQFDKKVEEYKKQYGFIGEAYTKYMNEHKEQLLSWRVKEVNW